MGVLRELYNCLVKIFLVWPNSGKARLIKYSYKNFSMIQMVMLIAIVDAIHYPSFDKEKIPKYRDFFGGEGGI